MSMLISDWLMQENHLRWDSLGEYLATAIGFQEIGVRSNDGEKETNNEKYFEIFLSSGSQF